MRTDSTRLSPLFIDEAFKYIKDNFGDEYVGAVKKSKKSENVQDAHEAIRPTSLSRTPESVKKYLSTDEYKIYSIIYARALASLMRDAKVLATSVVLDNNDYKFKTTGQILVFDGFLRVYGDYSTTNDVILPDFNKYNGIVSTDNIETEQKFTKPVSRYTEASLIEEMENLGIGRPSTYATTMKTLKDRDYVKIVDKKFHPTEIGIETNDKLQEFFSNIINVEYTANMESDLDKIADNNLDNILVLKEFYNDFEPLVKQAFSEMEKTKPKTTGEICPNCGSELVIRKGRFGEFTACSNYPTCKYIKKEEKEIKVICKCPKCEGNIIEKKTRRGKIFYGCDKYPKCDVALWDQPTGEICPECNSLLVSKKDEIKCSSCEYIK
jgi:DNA topoisomerase-1